MRNAKPAPSLRTEDRGYSYPVDLRKAREEFESRFLTVALGLNNGNVSKTSKMIGISRRNLQLKIQRLGIDLSGIRHEYSHDEIMMI